MPSKSHVAWVPSQKGLFDERPQRQRAIGSGCSISRPSGAVSVTGPEMRYGPFSLGVMLTSAIGVLLGNLDGVVDRESADPRPGERGDRIGERRCGGWNADFAD